MPSALGQGVAGGRVERTRRPRGRRGRHRRSRARARRPTTARCRSGRGPPRPGATRSRSVVRAPVTSSRATCPDSTLDVALDAVQRERGPGGLVGEDQDEQDEQSHQRPGRPGEGRVDRPGTARRPGVGVADSPVVRFRHSVRVRWSDDDGRRRPSRHQQPRERARHRAAWRWDHRCSAATRTRPRPGCCTGVDAVRVARTSLDVVDASGCSSGVAGRRTGGCELSPELSAACAAPIDAHRREHDRRERRSPQQRSSSSFSPVCWRFN